MPHQSPVPGSHFARAYDDVNFPVVGSIVLPIQPFGSDAEVHVVTCPFWICAPPAQIGMNCWPLFEPYFFWISVLLIEYRNVFVPVPPPSDSSKTPAPTLWKPAQPPPPNGSVTFAGICAGPKARNTNELPLAPASSCVFLSSGAVTVGQPDAVHGAPASEMLNGPLSGVCW